jgi:small subunit ribosomal protein S7
MAGGGKALPIPVPIGIRWRRKAAMKWILDSADKRTEVRLADRVSREIINVAEGTSSAWDKRQLVHKQAMTARANIKAMMAPGRRR